MKILEKIVKIVFNFILVFMIFMVIIVGYNFIQINIIGKNYSDIFGYTFFQVTTGSMSGTIEIDDAILVKITQDVKKDDIITYQEQGEIITHRVIEEKDNQLYTKGDANNAEDKPIDKSSVIGKVIKIFPKVGIWIKVFTDTKVIISIIITLGLFGFAISSEKEEKKEEKSFSRFMKNRRGKRNGKNKKKKESEN